LKCIKNVSNLYKRVIEKVKESKNIDRIFQENLKDYEVFPPNKSWNSIEKQLNGESKKRGLPFWLKISSIAALLVLFFSVGTIYFMPENRLTKNFLPKNNNSTRTTTLENQDSEKEVISSSKNGASNKSLKGKVIPLNTEEIPKSAGSNNQIVAETKGEDESSKKSLSSFAFENTEKTPYKKENKNVEKVLTESKFTVATIFAPIYFNSFGSGSGVDAQFNNNETSGGASYAYGVKFAYKLNKKFSVQSGVNMINIGQTTNDVYVAQGVAVVDLSSISNQPNISRNSGTISKESLDLAKDNSASLNQVFGYVEIPLELKYNVTSGKIGVNIVGGFSTLLLNKDEVFIETNSFSQSLGNSNNLRSVNFSGNFGVDIDYSIYRNLFINVSPMFKVQTNTFSKTSGDVQSYYLGVYTGLNYKF